MSICVQVGAACHGLDSFPFTIASAETDGKVVTIRVDCIWWRHTFPHHSAPVLTLLLSSVYLSINKLLTLLKTKPNTTDLVSYLV